MKASPLVIIALVFAASSSGRAVSLAEQVMATPEKPTAPVAVAAPSENTPPLLMSAVAPAPEPAETPAEAAPASAPAAPAAEETGRDALLAAIRERAAALEAREAKVTERERLLEVVEKRIDEKAAQLQSAKTDLESRLSFAETAVQNDITRLAKMYESMKPQKAGEIFNSMDASFAAGFLTSMSNDGAALVLANMSTEKAYAASVIIAGRNAAVNAP